MSRATACPATKPLPVPKPPSPSFSRETDAEPQSRSRTPVLPQEIPPPPARLPSLATPGLPAHPASSPRAPPFLLRTIAPHEKHSTDSPARLAPATAPTRSPITQIASLAPAAFQPPVAPPPPAQLASIPKASL